MRILTLLSIIFSLSTSSTASGTNNLPDDYLVFAHSKYHLKDFSFVSRYYSIGLVREPFQKQTLVVLYNDNNLVVDSLYTDWEIENVIPENDSVFFLQNRAETMQILIRDNELLINGQFSSTISNPKYEKIAFYTLPLENGDFNIVKRADQKKSYSIRVCKKDQSADFFPFDLSKRKMNIRLDASRNDLFIFLYDDKRIIKVNKNNLSFEEIALDKKEYKWHFFYDYIDNKSFLLGENKETMAFYELDKSNNLQFLMNLDFIPEAVFNGFLHKKASRGKSYSHYLIPIEKKEKEKSILLKDVEISSD